MTDPVVEPLASPNPATTDWVPMYSIGPIVASYVGAYDPARTYHDGEYVVGADGITYHCVKEGTVGITPTPWPSGPTTPYGTSLPASPYDGQEAILVDSITNPSYQWRFRYNAGSTSAYKWEFIGGTPFRHLWSGAPTILNAAPMTQVGSTGMYFPNVNGGGFVLVPRAGEYAISGNVLFDPNGTLSYVYALPHVGGTSNPIVYPRAESHMANVAWYCGAILDYANIGAVGSGVALGMSVNSANVAVTRLVHMAGNVWPVRVS